MKKELGKRLTDIAKYITAAVILTSIFGAVRGQWIVYVVGAVSVLLTLFVGLWLTKDEKKGV